MKPGAVIDNASEAVAYEKGDTEGMIKKLLSTGLSGFSLKMSIGSLADTFKAIRSKGLLGFLKSCFAAGTPLCTPEGSKPIEEFEGPGLGVVATNSTPRTQWCRRS